MASVRAHARSRRRREAREGVDVREVIVPCGRMEEWSETEVRAEGGRERGGYGCGVTTAGAEGGMGGGGGRFALRACEGEGGVACGGCACQDRGVYAGGDGGGCRALGGETAHGASRLGNRTLGQLG